MSPRRISAIDTLEPPSSRFHSGSGSGAAAAVATSSSGGTRARS